MRCITHWVIIRISETVPVKHCGTQNTANNIKCHLLFLFQAYKMFKGIYVITLPNSLFFINYYILYLTAHDII